MSDREVYNEFFRKYDLNLYSMVPEESAEAERALRTLAETGNVYAMVRMAGFLVQKGTDRRPEVDMWLERIARRYSEWPDDFDSRTLYQIGNIVSDRRSRGKEWRELDEASAREVVGWYSRSLSKGEYGGAIGIMCTYLCGPDSLADEGFAWCVRLLNYIEPRGRMRCTDRILVYLYKTARQGHAPSQYLLGVMYVKGDVYPRSDEMAAEWFAKAAEQGYGRALRAMEEYRRDGNFLALVTREYLEPDRYDVTDPFPCNVGNNRLPKSDHPLSRHDMMRFEKIYFDMDGVIDDLMKNLEDFVKREEELLNSKSDLSDGKRPEDEDAPSGVRYSLEWMSGRVKSVKDMFELFDEVHGLYGDRVEILTAVSKQDGSVDEEGLRRYTEGKAKVTIAPGGERKEYANGREYVLIDSNMDNLDEWDGYGGYAIQFIDPLSLRRELYDCGILECKDFRYNAYRMIREHFRRVADDFIESGFKNAGTPESGRSQLEKSLTELAEREGKDYRRELMVMGLLIKLFRDTEAMDVCYDRITRDESLKSRIPDKSFEDVCLYGGCLRRELWCEYELFMHFDHDGLPVMSAEELIDTVFGRYRSCKEHIRTLTEIGELSEKVLSWWKKIEIAVASCERIPSDTHTSD